MAAVPVDEVGGRVAAGQVLAGDAHPAVPHRPGRVDDGVVAGQQVFPGDVVAEVDATEEPHVRVLEHAAEVVGDGPDGRVVRGHAVADQAVGGGQPVQHVHPHGARRGQGGDP